MPRRTGNVCMDISHTDRKRGDEVRAKLSHPVIDADGHAVELSLAFPDFLKQVAGADELKRWESQVGAPSVLQVPAGGWWLSPSGPITIDRAMAMLPDFRKEQHVRAGIDFAVIYTTLGLQMLNIREDDRRRAFCRALNMMNSEMYAGHEDTMAPAAIVPIENPTEAINELGNNLAMQDQFDEAAQNFQRAADIYRGVHGERHYLVAIELSNVAYMHMQRKDYGVAEALFRNVIPLFAETLSPDNVNTGIARIKLGRTLLRAGRYSEAEQESLAGYEIVAKQASPSISFLRAARTDLVASYEAMQQPEKAARFRAESEALEAQGASSQ